MSLAGKDSITPRGGQLKQKTVRGTLFADDVLWWGLEPTSRGLFSPGLPADQLQMPVLHYRLPLLLNGNESFLFEHFTFFIAALKKGSQYFRQLHCIKSWPCKQVGHCMENQKPTAFTPAFLWAEHDLQVTLQLISLQNIWTLSTLGKNNTFLQLWTASALEELWYWVNPTTTVIGSHRQGPTIIMAKNIFQLKTLRAKPNEVNKDLGSLSLPHYFHPVIPSNISIKGMVVNYTAMQHWY